MKSIGIFERLLLAATIILTTTSAFATDVGVSISVGQPGFYGRIDIGDYPYPQPYLIYPRPIVIYRHAMVEPEPIYLRVPPGHAKRWRQYCSRYHACDQSVYFVQDRWYNDVYAPRYRELHGDRDYRGDGRHQRGQNKGYGNKGRGHSKGNRRE